MHQQSKHAQEQNKNLTNNLNLPGRCNRINRLKYAWMQFNQFCIWWMCVRRRSNRTQFIRTADWFTKWLIYGIFKSIYIFLLAVWRHTHSDSPKKKIKINCKCMRLNVDCVMKWKWSIYRSMRHQRSLHSIFIYQRDAKNGQKNAAPLSWFWMHKRKKIKPTQNSFSQE